MEVSAYFTAESLVATGFEAFKVAFKSLIQVHTNEVLSEGRGKK